MKDRHPQRPDDPKVVPLECDVTFAEFWEVSGFERVRYATEAGRGCVRDDAMDPRNTGRHAAPADGSSRAGTRLSPVAPCSRSGDSPAPAT